MYILCTRFFIKIGQQGVGIILVMLATVLLNNFKHFLYDWATLVPHPGNPGRGNQGQGSNSNRWRDAWELKLNLVQPGNGEDRDSLTRILIQYNPPPFAKPEF